VSGVWEPSASGWEVLQPMRYSATLPFLRHSVAWKELLPQLWSVTQAVTVDAIISRVCTHSDYVQLYT